MCLPCRCCAGTPAQQQLLTGMQYQLQHRNCQILRCKPALVAPDMAASRPLFQLATKRYHCGTASAVHYGITCRAAARSGADTSAVGNFFQAFQQMVEQAQRGGPGATPTGAPLTISDLTYQPPGTAAPLLQGINMQLCANSMGLIYGRSGAGKTTLLKILAGLAQQHSGDVTIGSAALSSQNGSGSVVTNGSQQVGSGAVTPNAASLAAVRTMKAGLVFQFPERHFLGATIAQELTFGWPQRPEDEMTRQQLSLRCGKVLEAMGLAGVNLDTAPTSLSDGFKRRLALAVQLVRGPAVLLLDEPLAGLDWRARADIAELLGKLKQECTILVVSHDLHELSDQVDKAWEMLPGGRLEAREEGLRQ